MRFWTIWALRLWPADIPAEPIQGTPEFSDHPRPPQLEDNFDLFSQAGCTYSASGSLECAPDSPLLSLDCSRLSPPQGIGAHLDPQTPLIARCSYEPDEENWDDDVYLHRVGCIILENVGYIFLVEGEYVLVNEPGGMQSLFAPITSPEEALDYARMLTGLHTQYDFPQPSPNLVYYASRVEDSHVTEVEAGYQVRLYNAQGCGCDTFLTSAVDVLIHRDGSMEWVSAEPVYLEVEAGLCVD